MATTHQVKLSDQNHFHIEIQISPDLAISSKSIYLIADSFKLSYY